MDRVLGRGGDGDRKEETISVATKKRTSRETPGSHDMKSMMPDL